MDLRVYDNDVVEVQGSGIAAACCQRLLSDQGLGLRIQAVDRPKVPAVMLSTATQSLLTDVFRGAGLLRDLPRIRRRVVAWGAKPALSLPHSAVVVSEHEMLARLQPTHSEIS